MIAISLWQPWASAIAAGLKKYETRSWAAECVGSRIAIHAAKTLRNPKTGERAYDWWMRHVKGFSDIARYSAQQFAAIGILDFCDLPLGAVVCTADLVAVETTEKLVETGKVWDGDSGLEFMWGNFAATDDQNGRPRYGWKLANVERLEKPAPCKGYQGFFTWDPATNETRGLPPAKKGAAV